MSKRKRRSDMKPEEAARMREVTELIKAGRWHAPNGGEVDGPFTDPGGQGWPDDGGLASSRVPKRPSSDSGQGSAAVEEPNN